MIPRVRVDELVRVAWTGDPEVSGGPTGEPRWVEVTGDVTAGPDADVVTVHPLSGIVIRRSLGALVAGGQADLGARDEALLRAAVVQVGQHRGDSAVEEVLRFPGRPLGALADLIYELSDPVGVRGGPKSPVV